MIYSVFLQPHRCSAQREDRIDEGDINEGMVRICWWSQPYHCPSTLVAASRGGVIVSTAKIVRCLHFLLEFAHMSTLWDVFPNHSSLKEKSPHPMQNSLFPFLVIQFYFQHHLPCYAFLICFCLTLHYKLSFMKEEILSLVHCCIPLPCNLWHIVVLGEYLLTK